MSTPPQGAPNADPQAHRELQALKAWRDAAVRSGRIRPNVIADTHLTEIVLRGRKHIPAVQNALHTSVKGLAEEIIEVQRNASAGAPGEQQSGAAAGSGSTGTGASGTPAAGRRVDPSPPVTTQAQHHTEQAPQPARQTSPQSAHQAPPQTARQAGADRTAAPDLDFLHSRIEPEFAPIRTIPAKAAKLGAVRLTPVAGGLRLRWPVDVDREPVTLHRVVARDDIPPYSPAGCLLVDIVTEIAPGETLLSSLDPRPPSAALRFFAVFEHGGRSLDEAYEAQPRLVAEGTYVFGVSDLEIREEDGLVIGRWTTAPGVSQVLVYRIPIERLAMGAGQDPEYLLDQTDPHLGGFVDDEAIPGRRYRYDVVVEVAQGGGLRQSDPLSAEVAISAPVVAITDLAVVRRYADDGSARFDISWSRPAAGQVLLFRTEKGPVAGATNGEHHSGVLGPQLGLRDEDQQKMPVVASGPAREGMRDLRGRVGWSRIHFTPVTLLNGVVRVGETQTVLVIGEPTQPTVVERCDHQVLKFGWPDGAAKVIVVPRGATDPVEVPTGGPGYEEIDKETYEKLGGLQFRGLLPRNGCAVHLAGVAFEGGGAAFGRPVSAAYPGLTRLRYTVEARQRMFRLDKLVVTISAEAPPVPAPAFVLVHRSDRLPLHVQDGTALPVVPDIPQVSQPTRQFRPDRLPPDGSGLGWVAEARGLTGYVRLFVDGPIDRLALLDPPAATLYVHG